MSEKEKGRMIEKEKKRMLGRKMIEKDMQKKERMIGGEEE